MGDPLDEKITSKQLTEILAGYLEWSIEYIRASRMGDEQLMQYLDESFDPEKLVLGVVEKGKKDE